MRAFIRHTLFGLTALLFLVFLGFEAYAVIHKPDVAKLPALNDGDLIFQTNPDTQSLAVMLASDTLLTHVGIIRNTDHGTVVVEVGPVRETALQAFIDRGVGRWVSIRRIKDLKPDDAANALAWAKKQYGKPYDFFFLKGTDQFYCSELVEDAYHDGAGISLGKWEKIGDLKKSAAMDEIISARWHDYPLCKGDASMTYEKCYQIIMRQELVTPASLARDPQTRSIWSNYPAGD
jgi:hypothetical protein